MTAAAPDVGAYSEPWRPQFHYSPLKGRMADPNGLVWFAGEWHLFHQQDGTWAHAVSTDLVHWEPLPTALDHDRLGQALSGSVVVDGANTSGLFDGVEGGGLVAVYTSTEGGEAQSLAYSSDDGRTWQRYAGNPVIPNNGRADFRDPKVFWHEPTRSWVMVVSVGGAVELFASPNLREWRFLSAFGDGQGLHAAVWECPDLFPLPLDGDPARTRWVLTVSVGDNAETNGSTAQYFVGAFDGTAFTRDPATPPSTVQVTDVGQDFYAAQTFEHAPGGRRIWMGWMGNWRYPYSAPTAPWLNAMSIPRELSLRTIAGRATLAQAPVAELTELRERAVTIEGLAVEGDVPVDVTSTTFEFIAEIDVGDADEVGLRVRERPAGRGALAEATAMGVDLRSGTFFLDRTEGGLATIRARDGSDFDFALRRTAAYSPPDGVVRLHGFVDESSVEVFVDDGALTGTLLTFPSAGADRLSVYANGGTATLRSLTVFPLRSIWR
ncbi:glycoside hydrolase family 32 protein [Cellulomonas timonensis]|uniref:glycoside hydrolase family 32 protein n=1 Tax=Cellulomonas timonensis TaxID=1689271 RepID=UPI001F335FBF|nr:glycoside hydrolase family 32 protein [Cellulomonas timonensis]